MTRILLVEDESALSEPLSFLLEREGYEVVVAEDGPNAISEFDQNGTDLILLDLMLPGIPGTEVCREIRTRSTVPIIMLSRIPPANWSPAFARCCDGTKTRARPMWTPCSRPARCAWTWNGTPSPSPASSSTCR